MSPSVAGVPAVLRARVCRAGMSVSSSGLLSLLPDSEGADRHAPAAAHSQQNLCHRRVLTDNVAAAFRAWTVVSSSTQTEKFCLRGEMSV